MVDILLFRRHRSGLRTHCSRCQKQSQQHEVPRLSLRKMTKKEPKAQPNQKNNNVSEFDDLLDDLLEKESKAIGILDNKPSLKEVKPKKDSFDFDFDEPKPKSPEKNKLIIKE